MARNPANYDMTEGRLLPKMVSFTLPFVLANLLNTLYSIADLAIIGHFAEPEVLSAVSIASQVTMFMTFIGTCFTNGGQIYIAQLVGQKRREDLAPAEGTLFSASLIAAVLVAGAGAAISVPMLGWLNTPAEAFDSALSYLLVCCPGILALYGYSAVAAAMRGMGNSRMPTVFISVSSVLNVVLDMLFVAGLRTGAFGAALATSLSQAIAFVLSLIFLNREKTACGLSSVKELICIRGPQLKVIAKLSAPLIISQAAISGSMLYVNSYINTFGLAAASLAGVGGKLYGVVSIVSSAFSAAMATVVGQNVGAKRYDRVRQALVISTGIDLCVFAVIAIVVLVFPGAVFGVFTSDEAVLELAPHYLRIAVWAYLAFALLHPAMGTINGVGATTYNSVVGILDGVVARIGLSLLLGSMYGMWGYFTGYCLAGFVSVICSWAYVFSGRWKKRRLLN